MKDIWVQLKNVNHGFDLEVGDVGCTIRHGYRWSNYVTGTPIELWNCKEQHHGLCTEETCTRCGTGVIIGSWCGKLKELPPSLLAMEHTNDLKDYDALFTMLKKVYDDFTSEKEPVTALIYLRTEKL